MQTDEMRQAMSTVKQFSEKERVYVSVPDSQGGSLTVPYPVLN